MKIKEIKIKEEVREERGIKPSARAYIYITPGCNNASQTPPPSHSYL